MGFISAFWCLLNIGINSLKETVNFLTRFFNEKQKTVVLSVSIDTKEYDM